MPPPHAPHEHAVAVDVRLLADHVLQEGARGGQALVRIRHQS